MKELINLQLMMFALIIIGLILKKTKVIGKEGQKNMTNLVIDLILPCNIIFSFMIKFSSKIAQDFMVILIISILIQVFCVILGSVLYNKCSVKRKKCLRYATICSNAGFLGNPIAQGVYGMMGLTLASIYLIPQSIIACEIGVVLMLTGWRPPHFLQETITSISNCNTAMSMLVIGMILADADPRTLVDKDVLFYSVIRLIIIPFCVFIPCWMLHIDSLVKGVSVLLAAMPAGATTTILASKYDCEEEFSVKLVVFSTAASLLTTPIWSLILMKI